MQISPIYAQLSRGKFELAALEALGGATLDLRRIAWDLSLFTSAEFGFRAAGAVHTGSSIMPNKRNPDVIELMRHPRQRRRRAHRDRAAAVAAVRLPSRPAVVRPSSTASAVAWPRWTCCRRCWPIWNGVTTSCARRLFGHVCHRRCGGSGGGWRAVPQLQAAAAGADSAGQGRTESASPRACPRVRSPTCAWTSCARWQALS